MKIVPLHNHIVIKQNDNSEEMYGNILIPDMGKEKPLMGEVVAVGPGIFSVTGEAFIETKIKVGQTVVFPAFGGTKMTIEGEEYVVMKESDLLVILEK
jgi:chaperonin GroES